MDLLKRQDAIKELKTEQRMREKVWRKASSKPVRFLDMEHQRRYDVLTQLIGVLETMTDQDFFTLAMRKAENDKAAGAQKSLF